MRKPTNRLVRGGFTLIEILVVLVIMGFLVAMVAPKLSNITDRAIDTTCDTNQQRLRAVMAEWTKMNSTLPSGLTNIVIANETGNADYEDGDAAIPSVSNNDKSDGAEILSAEFAERWLPTLHNLNAAEATELVELVGGAVLNYGLTDDTNVTGASPIVENSFRQKVRNTLPVMMIGAGINTTDDYTYATGAQVKVNKTTITVDDNIPTSTAASTSAAVLAVSPTGGANYAESDKIFAKIAEAPMALRIIMGLSNRNRLVTSGMLDESGVCPGQVKAADQFEYGNYSLILPRLQATVDRFILQTATSGLELNGGVLEEDVENVVAHAVNFNENDDGTYTLAARTPHDPSKGISGVNLNAQGSEEVTTTCPEGHAFGEIADWFGISMSRGKGMDAK